MRFHHVPGQIQAVRYTGQVVDQPFLKKEPDDIVHAIVLGLGCCCAVEAGCGGTRFHDSADDAHYCLKPVKQMQGQIKNGSPSNVIVPIERWFTPVFLCCLPGMFFGTFSHRQCSTEGSLHLIDQGHLGISASASSCQAGQEQTCQGWGVLVLRILSVGQQVVEYKG